MRALVELIAEPVRRYLHRRTDAATADDVLGDVLLVCWRRLDEVPPADADALPWAIVVARQCLANAQRAERRRTRLVGRIIAIDPPPVSADDDGPDGDGDRDPASLRVAMARLRRDDAEILRLWAWDELTTTQIAVVLGISANAASIRLHRAKARLKAELDIRPEAGLKAAPASGHVRAEEGSTDARR